MTKMHITGKAPLHATEKNAALQTSCSFKKKKTDSEQNIRKISYGSWAQIVRRLFLSSLNQKQLF